MTAKTFTSPHLLSDEVSAMRYVIYLLSCARRARLGPLAEHVTRSMTTSVFEPEPEAGANAQTAQDDPLAGASLDDRLAAYTGRYGGLLPHFAWRTRSGSEAHPAGGPRSAGEYQRRTELENLIANAHAQRVVFTWDADHPGLAGSVRRTTRPTPVRRDLTRPPEDFRSDDLRATAIGPVVVYLNTDLPGDCVFNVLLHELANLLLMHVGPDPLKAAEPEPFSMRLGMHRPLREVEAERVFVVAEILIAWCRTRPDREPVERPQRITAPTGGRRRKVLVEGT